jgi:hypothetical protein
VPPEPPLCPGFRAPPCAERGPLACAAQDISACCTLAARRYSSQKRHIQTKLARTAPALCRACRFLLLLADASSLASAWLQSDSSQSSSTSSPAPYLPVQHNCISDVVLHDYFAEFDHTVHAVPGGGSAPSGTAAPPYTTPLASPCSKPCIAVRNSMSTALFTSYTLYGSPHHQHCTPRVSRVFLCKIRNTFLCVATVTQG